MESLTWNRPGKTPFVAFDHVGSEAMFFNAYAWIDDRTLEPWYRGRLLSELVDALEAAGVSVGQTTNLSITPPEGVPVIQPALSEGTTRRWRKPPRGPLTSSPRKRRRLLKNR